ncbi:hypothetical protein HKA98_01425, partial [Vibrio parahaemolyticus]|nr:hypothetical protein [Vibrio parahaemolyticus]
LNERFHVVSDRTSLPVPAGFDPARAVELARQTLEIESQALQGLRARLGGEFAQEREWAHEGELDWHLTEWPEHRGVQRLVQQLNRLYAEEPALHRTDFSHEGFQWVETHDAERSV